MTVSLMPDLRSPVHLSFLKGVEVGKAALSTLTTPALRVEAAKALRAAQDAAEAAGDTEAVWQTKGALSVVLKAQKEG